MTISRRLFAALLPAAPAVAEQVAKIGASAMRSFEPQVDPTPFYGAPTVSTLPPSASEIMARAQRLRRYAALMEEEQSRLPASISAIKSYSSWYRQHKFAEQVCKMQPSPIRAAIEEMLDAHGLSTWKGDFL